MKSSKFLRALFPLLLAPCIGHTEMLREGYPVCESKEKLQEFLTHGSSKEEDDRKVYEYVIVKQWCVYPAVQRIQVRSMGADGIAVVLFPGARIEAWASVKAIRRREQPPLTNILIEDADHPDGASVCRMISSYTRNPSERTLEIAEGVVSVNSARLGAAAPAYGRALPQQVYDLVTDWRDGQCVAELDLPGQRLIACSIDQFKYWQCRRARKNEAELCYRNLCSGAAPPSDARSTQP
jgi:hypothetical protein